MEGAAPAVSARLVFIGRALVGFASGLARRSKGTRLSGATPEVLRHPVWGGLLICAEPASWHPSLAPRIK